MRARKPVTAEAKNLSLVQAAKEEGLPYATLRAAGLRGDLPIIRMGRAWYVARRDLARFIENAKQTLGG